MASQICTTIQLSGCCSWSLQSCSRSSELLTLVLFSGLLTWVCTKWPVKMMFLGCFLKKQESKRNGKRIKETFYTISFDLNLWLDVWLQYVLWLWHLYFFCLPLVCPEMTEPSCSNEVSGDFSQWVLISFQGLISNSDHSWKAESRAVPLKPCTPKWDFWEGEREQEWHTYEVYIDRMEHRSSAS